MPKSKDAGSEEITPARARETLSALSDDEWCKKRALEYAQ
jgi:hypothetical protein